MHLSDIKIFLYLENKEEKGNDQTADVDEGFRWVSFIYLTLISHSFVEMGILVFRFVFTYLRFFWHLGGSEKIKLID